MAKLQLEWKLQNILKMLTKMLKKSYGLAVILLKIDK